MSAGSALPPGSDFTLFLGSNRPASGVPTLNTIKVYHMHYKSHYLVLSISMSGQESCVSPWSPASSRHAGSVWGESAGLAGPGQ